MARGANVIGKAPKASRVVVRIEDYPAGIYQGSKTLTVYGQDFKVVVDKLIAALKGGV